MKYKVGDKVRIIDTSDNSFRIGDIAEIINTSEGTTYEYACKNKWNEEWIKASQIEQITKANYTWEDFLKAPIGTKVTFKSGEILFKNDKDEYGEEFANMRDNYSYEDLENFELKDSDYGKITKIEEPTYTTVYEPTEQIEEMTLEEVCKELGREIKIVKEKK